MTEIIKDLYQFTEVMEPIKLSMHQYLLMTNEPVLIQTGAVSQAQTTIPKLQELLGERKIKYILISHFESDECGVYRAFFMSKNLGVYSEKYRPNVPKADK
ncbi:hypothetical protein U9Y44_13480 [Escherichia coli]